jgi:hypothetical protein
VLRELLGSDSDLLALQEVQVRVGHGRRRALLLAPPPPPPARSLTFLTRS